MQELGAVSPRGAQKSTRGTPSREAEAGQGGLFALGTDRVGGLAVDRVVAHFQGRLIHAQRHDERDDLEDDEGGDDVVDDDERRALGLQQKLRRLP